MNIEQLVIDAKSGDAQAFRALFKEYRQFLEIAVYRHIWDKDFLLDVLQSVHYKVVAYIKQFKGHCHFSTWLYRIAINECREYNRKTARDRSHASWEEHEETWSDPNQQDGLAHLTRKELLEAISCAANTLSPALYEAFKCYYVKGENGKDAAVMLGISEAAFFVRLQETRQQIKMYLQKNGLLS
jgi:RNA polymerase sigma-70 factor (ECF subfamily)